MPGPSDPRCADLSGSKAGNGDGPKPQGVFGETAVCLSHPG